MSRKYNTGIGGKKAKGYGGSGMTKHGKSGHAHNHRVTIEMNREAGRAMEQERAARAKQKGTMYGSVAEAFKRK